MSKKRLKIPDDVKLKLWVLSGGRCEFPGCNKPLWRDGLTLKEDNFAQMAHVIAQSADGPRGNSNLSAKRAINFDNLMLLCAVHHKLVDGKNKQDYPASTLSSYKQEHERRIQLQTSLSDNMKTTLVLFKANIGSRVMNISLPQVYKAIQPRYPEEKEILLDFTDQEGQGKKDFWTFIAKEITRQFKEKFRRGANQPSPSHLSIFALGPIPFLIHLGNTITDITPTDLYQKHRDTDDWAWKTAKAGRQPSFKTVLPKKKHGVKDIALAISVSGKVQKDTVMEKVPKGTPLYEITADKLDVGVLNSVSNLADFRTAYRSVINSIRDTYGHNATIHLFPAIPAPVAVICGQVLLPKVDPHIIVYDYNHQNGGYIKTLKIN